MELLTNFMKPVSQAYFESVFAGHVFKLNKVYILLRIVTNDFRNRIFQYNVLHNV